MFAYLLKEILLKRAVSAKEALIRSSLFMQLVFLCRQFDGAEEISHLR